MTDLDRKIKKIKKKIKSLTNEKIKLAEKLKEFYYDDELKKFIMKLKKNYLIMKLNLI